MPGEGHGTARNSFEQTGTLIRDRDPRRVSEKDRIRELKGLEFSRYAGLKIHQAAIDLLRAHIEKNRSKMILATADLRDALDAFLKNEHILPEAIDTARGAAAEREGLFNKHLLLENAQVRTEQ